MTTSPTSPRTADPAEAPATAPRRSPWATVLAVAVGLAVAVTLMLLAFLTPTLYSGADDLPVAISGPAPAVEQMSGQLESANPDAIELTVMDSADDVTGAVEDRDAVGGISVAEDGTVTIVTAGAAGAPYAQLMGGIATAMQQTGAEVTTTDVAPLTEDDPTGVGLGALGLPLAFGGMISAVLLSTLLGRHPWHRLAGGVLASVLVGFTLTAVLQFGVGSVDGDYVLTSLALSLGVAAVSLTILGLQSLLSAAGLGIGALLIMFVANPLSGMSTGWQWLPAPWGAIGQGLPLGAAGTLLRSVAFFDGGGALVPALVLTAWTVFGTVLIVLSASRSRRRATAAAHRAD